MAVKTSIEVAGIKEALREINYIQPSLRREITRNFKQITKPVVSEAKSRVPKAPPISGWGRTWKTPDTRFQMLPWNPDPAKNLINTQVSGKRPKEFAGITRDLAVLVIRWRGMVNTVYDTANNPATPQGANMIRGLTSNHGGASRVMWPAYEKHETEVERQIKDQVEYVMELVNRRLDKDTL
jgi:hypothetical protein